MNRHKLLGLLAVGLLAAGVAAAAAQEKKGDDKKGETVEGTILKVDPSAYRLTIMLKDKKDKQATDQREFKTGDATKFVFTAGGGKKEQTGKEAYKSELLKEGARVTVVTDAAGQVTEVRVGPSVKDEGKK